MTLATFDSMLFGCVLMMTGHLVLATLVTLIIWQVCYCKSYMYIYIYLLQYFCVPIYFFDFVFLSDNEIRSLLFRMYKC